jgi:hypothetical protein
MESNREVPHVAFSNLPVLSAADTQMLEVNDKLSVTDKLKQQVLSIFGKQEWARIEKEGKVRYVKVSVIAQDAGLKENKIRQNLSRIRATSWKTLQEEIESRQAYRKDRETYNTKIKELQGFKELKKELNQRQLRKIVVYVNTKTLIATPNLA